MDPDREMLLSDLQILYEKISYRTGVSISTDLQVINRALNQISDQAKIDLETDIKKIFDESGWDLSEILRGEKPEVILKSPRHVLYILDFLKVEIEKLKSVAAIETAATVPPQIHLLREQFEAHLKEEDKRGKSWREFFEKTVRRHNLLVINGLSEIIPEGYTIGPEIDLIAYHMNVVAQHSPENQVAPPDIFLNQVGSKLEQEIGNNPSNIVLQDAGKKFNELRNLIEQEKWTQLITKLQDQASNQPVPLLSHEGLRLLPRSLVEEQNTRVNEEIQQKTPDFARKYKTVAATIALLITETALANPNTPTTEIFKIINDRLDQEVTEHPEKQVENSQVQSAITELSLKPEVAEILQVARNSPIPNSVSRETIEEQLKYEMDRDFYPTSAFVAKNADMIPKILQPEISPVLLYSLVAAPLKFILPDEGAEELKSSQDKTAIDAARHVEAFINDAIRDLQDELKQNARFDAVLGESVIEKAIINQRKEASVKKLTRSLREAEYSQDQIEKIITRYKIHTQHVGFDITPDVEAYNKPPQANFTIAVIHLTELKKAADNAWKDFNEGQPSEISEARLNTLLRRVIRSLTDSPQEQKLLREHFDKLFPIFVEIKEGRLKFKTPPTTVPPTRAFVPGKRVFPTPSVPRSETGVLTKQVVTPYGIMTVPAGIAERESILSQGLTGGLRGISNAMNVMQGLNTARTAAAAARGAGTFVGAIGAIPGAKEALVITAIVIGAMFFGFININDLTAVGPYSEASPAPATYPGGTTGGSPNASYLVTWNGETPPISEVTGCPVTGGFISQCPYRGHRTYGNSQRAYDIAVPESTPVKATHDGFLASLSGNVSGYGIHVVLVGNSATYGLYKTVYAHLLSVSDVVDQYGAGNCPSADNINGNCLIRTGTIIGFVDNTDFGTDPRYRSTGVHLHYEHIGDGPIPYSPSQCSTGSSC